MNSRHLLLGVPAALTVSFLALLAPRLEASGLLVADGGFGGQLEIEEHAVSVTINNGIAITRVRQVFRNLEERQVEALYTFPVPKKASVSNFSMWINDKEMVGEVLEKKRAREIYDSYKQRRRDPGLLEQVDYKSFEMRIFPIGPRAQQRVEITYYQELDVDQDWATYVYPLATVTRTDLAARTAGRFSFDLEVKSEIPITEIESPSHRDDFALATHAPEYVQASLETRDGDLDRDVVVAFHLERARTGLDLITSSDKGEDGYFCLLLTAGQELEKLEKGMDYVFVLDVSGSMAHDGKLRLSAESIGAFVEALGPEDRFELIAFNVQPTTVFGSLQKNSEEARAAASVFLSSREARGGTVLRPAVELAYRYHDSDRPLVVLVLSDGMTKQDERAALRAAIRKRPAGARVFCVGVGNEVNRPLLRSVAEDSGGLAAFISHGDNFARQAKAFRRKLTHPAAENVHIELEGIDARGFEPRSLPNLYNGTPVRLYGRYHKPGVAKVTVRAEVAGRPIKTTAELEFPEIDAENPEIERMWAWHGIDRLLGEKDERGETSGLIGEIVRLGELYSIPSEYTSFLVLENDAEYRRWQIERRNLRRIERDRAAQERLAVRLREIRERAVVDLGPQGAQGGKQEETQELASAAPARPAASPTSQTSSRQAPAPAPAPARRAPSRPSRRSRGVDIGFGGGGPVGPLFLGAAWLLRRRKRVKAVPVH